MREELVGIIYDCDGVMIDSEDANRYFYNTILEAFDLAPMTLKQEEFAFRATSQQALEAMLPPGCLPALASTISRVIDYSHDILPRTRLVPGFRKFIEDAHSRGLRQAIDTNRTDEGIVRVLDFFDLPNYFDPVVTATRASPKPSPEGIFQICEAWGCDPGRAVFIGDSQSDFDAATTAGTAVIRFGKFHPACSYGDVARMLWGDSDTSRRGDDSSC